VGQRAARGLLPGTQETPADLGVEGVGLAEPDLARSPALGGIGRAEPEVEYAGEVGNL
jgi:hypothetical protein